MSDEREAREEPESTEAPTTTDSQENHNAETDEDTASGGAPADPDPAHF